MFFASLSRVWRYGGCLKCSMSLRLRGVYLVGLRPFIGLKAKTDSTPLTRSPFFLAVPTCKLNPSAERTSSVIHSSVKTCVRQFISSLLVSINHQSINHYPHIGWFGWSVGRCGPVIAGRSLCVGRCEPVAVGRSLWVARCGSIAMD